jgi:tetratricopeptide (TPR) repeat protein
LGDVDTAIEELLVILKKKSEWFIQAELCELYFSKGNYTEAIKYGTLAANNYGDTEYKIGLFLQMGSLLEAMNEIEKAYEHYLLVKLIRDEQKWKITTSLKDFLARTKKDYKIEWKDSKSLLKHLQEFWKPLLPDNVKADQKSSKNLKGVIKTIPPGKNFGFIIGDNNQEYHFFTDQLREESNKFARGVKVIFDSKPAKQEGKKPSALNLRLQK